MAGTAEGQGMGDVRMAVRKLTAADPKPWDQVGDQQVFVNDRIDQASEPDAKMTVGFARVGKGESMDIAFPYDEVLVVTKGTFTVHTEHGETVTARAGDVIYLPGGTSNSHHADEDAEMVYVASPPAVYAEHVAQAAAGD